MKSPGLSSIYAASFLAACALPILAAAQSMPAAQTNISQPVHYTLTDLGPSGPPPGQPVTLADNGLIGGSVVSNGTAHAAVWYQQLKLDINKPGLGGPNSFAFGVNNWGLVSGEAETSTQDPYGEDFCGFKASGLTSHGTCLPFLWEYGKKMVRLPILGGHNGAANQINDWGEVVGTAETAKHDRACPGPQIFQFKPVLWVGGKVFELATSGMDVNGAPFSDPDGVAFAINQNHLAVGGSGLCAPYSPETLTDLQPLHALLWEGGKVTDLGNLGGDGKFSGNIALNLNNKGEVVGNSDLPGDATNHAFLWTKSTGMQDLGTLPGDFISAGLAINDDSIVVGVSLDANFNQRAFLWENGLMTDLNTLVPASSHWHLILACSINSRGEIIGLAVDTTTGLTHGYLATPGDAEQQPGLL